MNRTEQDLIELGKKVAHNYRLIVSLVAFFYGCFVFYQNQQSNSLEISNFGLLCWLSGVWLVALYRSAVRGGELKPNLSQYRECDLIDDLLYSAHITFKGKSVYLYQYPRLFGFCGTCLSGLILTFLMGLSVGSVGLMLSGLAMGRFTGSAASSRSFTSLENKAGTGASGCLALISGGCWCYGSDKKVQKHLIALSALVLALVCLFKPEYAENVARALMLLIAGRWLMS